MKQSELHTTCETKRGRGSLLRTVPCGLLAAGVAMFANANVTSSGGEPLRFNDIKGMHPVQTVIGLPEADGQYRLPGALVEGDAAQSSELARLTRPLSYDELKTLIGMPAAIMEVPAVAVQAPAKVEERKPTRVADAKPAQAVKPKVAENKPAAKPQQQTARTEAKPKPAENLASIAKPRGERVVLSPEMRRVRDWVNSEYNVRHMQLEPVLVQAEKSAAEAGVDPLLLVAMMAVESSFNARAQSRVGAQGLMQVIPRWHKDKIGKGAPHDVLLRDPVLNVRVGTEVLVEGMQRYGSLQNALQYYGGARNDPKARYTRRVLAMKERIVRAAR